MADRRYALLGHTHDGLGAATAWGSITGTLSSQTDLQSALDAKSATGHTHLIANITDFTDNSTNWDTAYGWGDHSLGGYLTAVTAGDVDAEASADGYVLTSDGLGNAAWEAVAGGGGDVTKVGTPVDNQIGVWTGDGTLEGDANLTWDGTQLNLPYSGSIPTTPAISFNTDTGFYEYPANTLRISIGGTATYQMSSAGMSGVNSASGSIRNTTASGINPSLCARKGDANSGIGARNNDEISFIAGGVEYGRIVNYGSADRWEFLEPMFIEERGAAIGDIATFGQLWVKNDAPNVPMFTDDAGGDQLLDPSRSEINTQNAAYTLVLADKGKTIHKATSTASITHTIPANSSVAFALGTLIAWQNDGTVDMTIAITTDTLTGTDAVTGSRTLGAGHTAVIQKMTATTWKYAASDL